MIPFTLSRKKRKRLFVLSIDGVPFSFLKKAFASGMMPEFAYLSRQGAFVRMKSVIPTISSVAWATFMTGVNPAKHNIYGFVEKDEEMHRTIPTSRDLKAKTLWERLNEQEKRTIVINVPMTYPPKPLNGILVSGFLSPSLEKACWPPAVSQKLSAMGYIVDPDPRKAKDDKDGFLEDCFEALRVRREAALEFLRSEDWDFFMLHLMETDRVNHFYWDAYLSRGAGEQGGGARYHQRFWEFYREVDRVIKEVHEALPEGTEFLVLSDHGFCGIEKEVDINAYLCEQGFLEFREGAEEPAELLPHSKAYSLIPGRIFINLKGRELTGSVEPDDYESLREEIIRSLLDFRDPDTGAYIIKHVYRREEIYDGPYFSRAADLIAHPHRGYDLKAKIGESQLFARSHRVGMHTYEDASLFVKGHNLTTEGGISIVDVAPTIFRLMDFPIPDGLDGRNLL
jgi:predicted AlkP superfamily phosphohydrolase/phosphomutase